MRVRFKIGSAVSIDGKLLMLDGVEANVEEAPDGRYELKIPTGDHAGETIYVERELFEEMDDE